MSIMSLVPDTGGERPAAQIAGRVRAVMAEHRLQSSVVAKAIGMSQPAFSRRYSGELDWSVDQLWSLAQAFGMSFNDLCAIRDSNPEPADSTPRQPALAGLQGGLVSNLVDLAGRRSRPPEIVCVRPVFALVQGGAA
jgi:transcriptional regulator with XRE-family HTH domain